MVNKETAFIGVALDVEPELVLGDVIKVRPEAKIGELDVFFGPEFLAVNLPDFKVALFFN